MSEENRMYKENRKSINFFVGCEFNCIYCIPSFQRQMKRQKCPQCKTYTPHPHLERLKKPPPKTKGDEFIFFPSSSDWAFIPKQIGEEAIAYMEKYSDRKFLCQTKDPRCFARWKFPENAILAITLETNFATLTREISKAPDPVERLIAFQNYPHKSKIVTIEPILEFDALLIKWLKLINPKPIIYIGYDNHNCKLAEPEFWRVIDLIETLETKGFEVRRKTLRRAWYE